MMGLTPFIKVEIKPDFGRHILVPDSLTVSDNEDHNVCSRLDMPEEVDIRTRVPCHHNRGKLHPEVR